uniref:Uncharacterized protein n=1 Tax=Helicotheca tamesis TaxID=374047 RepID=A0A7S2DWY2_9STRA|mmetsp:Transcript_10410/g.14562  ORF Transcript_10410/g.14562 Transcript_10410/m.14562 type:complete len:178 (+) Transcript_10410:56-589(+)|eukprot:CAMPEP_0185723486 /NCGR_PEP_ID=MMETSP1171-20130828/322_1 /TAXON_ID=374046 /ORGANISM="Helicotheca tamensis, Strain CCMP826" /LENGTH=177 /DNA_ID=CAMNT_0028391197 /DNA_START=8 /DNA_END=541 /DNA_ORIENTATION=+
MSSSPDKSPEPKLFHPALAQLPVPIRFMVSGLVGTIFFMGFYNRAYAAFQSVASASQVFAVVQFLCIIVNHFLNVGIIFGWPESYMKSLMSNMPVGIVSLGLGAFSMGQMEKMDFDAKMEELVGFAGSSPGDDGEEEKGGLFSSIAVVIITGVFNYVVLNIINAPSPTPSKEPKKEL